MTSDSTEVEKSFRFLLYSRALRSVGIIYMTITMPLYLAAMGLSVVSIGFVVAGVMLFMMVETLILGALGDRTGYKYSLLISEIIPAFGALVIFFSQSVPVIIAAVIVAGIGGDAGRVLPWIYSDSCKQLS
jgi:MFS family permease